MSGSFHKNAPVFREDGVYTGEKMALRQIRMDKDPVLRKQTREISEITQHIRDLAQDMFDTMYQAEGVGLAAPQVGILKKMVVIDTGENPIVLINPVVSDPQGSIVMEEACLSFPDRSGQVVRPEQVKVTFTDLDGNEQTLECDGLLARAVCHEVDHLNGIVFLDRVIEGTLHDDRI